MARHYSKAGHLIRLLPLNLLLLLAAAWVAGTLLARSHGWHWQGLAWDQGPVVGRVVLRDGDCLRLVARHLRLRDVWPLRLSIARVNVPDCRPSGNRRRSNPGLPVAPAFDVVVQEFRFQDYPAVKVAAHHRGKRWRLQVHLDAGDLHAAYTAGNGRWQLSGQLALGSLFGGFAGTVQIRGSGYWRPRIETQGDRFGGQARIVARQLGREGHGPHARVTATVSWQDRDWTLAAALARPLALGRGWILQPGRAVHARGTGLRVEHASASLAVHGPRGQVRLSLQSNAGDLGSGHGQLVLSEGVSGRIDLRWKNGRLRVQPFAVSLPGDAVVRLTDAIEIPVARKGRVAPEVTLSYAGAQLHTTASRLSWRYAKARWNVRWQGAVALDGHWRGYRLDGGWSGSIDRHGLHGEALVAILDGTDLHLRARLPAARVWPPDWPVTLQLDGRFMGQAFTAAVSAQPAGQDWRGRVQAHFSLPQVDRGGEVAFKGRWQWRDSLVLLPGARLRTTRALAGSVLILPIDVTAATAIAFTDSGIRGRLQLDAGGLTAARWALPPIDAELTFDQRAIHATLRIPRYDATLTINGHDLASAPQGTFRARLPLQPDVTRGLSVLAGAGVVTASGHWRAGGKTSITGRLQARNVELSRGSVMASGIQADLAVRWRPGDVHISSRAPMSVARLAVGIPVTDIRLSLATDLQTWHLYDLKASVLGGRLSAAALAWPSSAYQPVVLTGIDMAQLTALQSTPVVSVTGEVGGTIPVRLGRAGVSIRNGQLENETPLTLSINKTDSVRALKDMNRAVGAALDVLSPLRIKEFEAQIDMRANGWLKASVRIRGINPKLTRPIVLNYTHRENMYELLRSLRIGGRIADAIIDRDGP